MSVSTTLTAQHRACDAEFNRLERAAYRGDWAAAAAAARAFVAATEHHFQVEEESLFPALEAATPMAAGPTAVMRAGHAQLRALLPELLADLGRHDADTLADRSFGSDLPAGLGLDPQPPGA